MRRIAGTLLAAGALLFALTPTASAQSIRWECSFDGGITYEVFLEAPHAALHGLTTANAATAGAQAIAGEMCRVVES